MNQTTIDTTLRRLGLWVGYRRKRLLNQSRLTRFRQANFILTSRLHPYFDYPSGHAVCSRNTLSNLENGGLLREPSLLPYFMRKLGVNARFSEFNWLLTQTLYERFDQDIRTASEFSIDDWLKEFKNHADISMDNVLFQCELPWIKAFLTWLGKPQVNYELDLPEFLNIYPFLNPTLQGLFSDWIAFLILSQMDHWPKATSYLDQLIIDENRGDLCLSIWHLFKGNILFSHKNFRLMMGRYHPHCRIATFYQSYLDLFLHGQPIDQINPNEVGLPVPELFSSIAQNIDHLKKTEPKRLIKYLRHEPFPHAFRKQWIMEMAWHIKVTGHYKRFLDLFVDLNSIDQSLE